MPKNLDHVIVDLDGKPIAQDDSGKGKHADIRFVAVNALLASVPGDNPTGDEKAQRYALAIRINAGGEQEFTPEELALVKRLVGQVYGPLIVGQVYEWAKV